MGRLVPKKIQFAASLFLTCLVAESSIAENHPCRGQKLARGVISQAMQPYDFTLVGQADRYFLSGLHLPAGNAFKSYLVGHATLAGMKSKPDRYNRIPVHAYVEGTGVKAGWIQGALLRDGRALVYATEEQGTCLLAMRRAEHAAETARRGIWKSSPVLPADAPADLLSKEGRFVLVAGTVHSVGNRKSRLYLNFGSNWSEDFTVSIVKQGRGAYSGDIDALLPLKGRVVRIRGILDNSGGPLVRVFHESQIEILSGR